MPTAAYRAHELEWQVFRGADAVRRDLLTEHQLRSLAWIRLRQDVYADARLNRDHALVCRAVAMRTPPGVVIAGPSAAYLHGIDHAATFTDDVHILAPSGIRVAAQRGVRIHVTRIAPTDTTTIATPNTRNQPALPVTAPDRTAWDIAARLPTPRAVAILDAMLRHNLLTPTHLTTLVNRYAGCRGSKRAHTAFDLADAHSPDPTASHLRTRLVQAGIPKPQLDHAVTLTAGLTILPDLAWPTYRVAVEYTPHRIALLTAAGWLVIHIPPHRGRKDFPAAHRELCQALTRRGWKEPESTIHGSSRPL
ncbi:hypothetical protein [Rhizomonospora bruguierae]|uniref:hypothetical protein n=1 Tax=Rhizomonospora bruguierae TaxID=1581705 RepID=UPI001BCAF394|nr:hypothetical protein [Micromonospora sp. NBRC 107566]